MATWEIVLYRRGGPDGRFSRSAGHRDGWVPPFPRSRHVLDAPIIMEDGVSETRRRLRLKLSWSLREDINAVCLAQMDLGEFHGVAKGGLYMLHGRECRCWIFIDTYVAMASGGGRCENMRM